MKILTAANAETLAYLGEEFGAVGGAEFLQHGNDITDGQEVHVPLLAPLPRVSNLAQSFRKFMVPPYQEPEESSRGSLSDSLQDRGAE